MKQRTARATWVWIAGGIILAFLIIITGGVILLQTKPAFAATFADNVLRPLIGDVRTVQIEAVLFRAEDVANREKYRYVKPSADLYQAPQPAVTPPNAEPTAVATADPALTSLTPINLNAGAFSPLPGEGQWQPIVSTASPSQPVSARTFVRPDPARSFAIVTLIAMDMSRLNLAAVAGTQHPGGESHQPGPGIIPPDIQAGNDLVAAFNGGFQEKDGEYGMVVGDTTYVPLRKNLATLIIPKSGPLRMEAYGGEPVADAAAIRQNGLLLIKNGQLQTAVLKGNQLWAGATITGDFNTWRSGIGLRPDGTLIYAVGPSLSAAALADALQSAGVTTAMELDINAFWVRYVLYDKSPSGQYSYTALVKDMANGGKAYLNGYEKDFFYVYLKPAN